MNASVDPFHLSDPAPAPARGLPLGTVIGRVEIVRPIADNGLCVEYLAIDHARETKAILREYLPGRLARREGDLVRPHARADTAAFAQGMQAFVTEGRLLAGIDHPALVHVTEVIEANGTAYQVMLRHDGTRLVQVRQEMAGAPDEPALRTLLDGLLSALDALHRSGTLHGSVSPANILLLADNRPLLLAPDHARAKIASNLVESLMAAVEPSFAAPEQDMSSPAQPLGPWTDLYGLAETIRFCISGELPPPAAEPSARGPRDTMTPLARRLFAKGIAMHYSKPLLDALDAALRADPAARPQSVAEFREVLSAKPADAAPSKPDQAATARTAGGSQARTTPRIEPDFKPVDKPLPASASAPAAVTPPHAPRRALRTGIALALLLAAGSYGWWTIERPARIDLAASAISTPATDPPVAAMPAPEPAPEPVREPVATPPQPAMTEAAAPSVTAIAPAPPPAQPAPQKPAPVLTAPAKTAIAANPATSPRDACAGRTQFALYRCMQAQCDQPDWTHHPQCQRLRSTDSVD